jgi:hypothetical protein
VKSYLTSGGTASPVLTVLSSVVSPKPPYAAPDNPPATMAEATAKPMAILSPMVTPAVPAAAPAAAADEAAAADDIDIAP